MNYVTVSHWSVKEMSDELNKIAQDKFVPLVKSAGAKSVDMVQTGDNSMMVVTYYSSEEEGLAAQKKIAEIRSQASEELPMKMESAHAGNVIING